LTLDSPSPNRQAFPVVDSPDEIVEAVAADIETQSSDSLDAKTLEAIQSAVSEQLLAHRKKTNQEFAGLRRKIKGGEMPPSAEESKSNGRDASGDQLTVNDVSALIKLGRLQGQVPDETSSAIQALDLSPTQEVIILEAIIDGTPNRSASKGRDAREIQRVATSATRDSVPLPRSQKDYLSLRHSDPRRYAQLAADDSFDPTELPMRG